MTPQELALRRRLAEDLPGFCAAALQIRSDARGLQPLRLNPAQALLHGRLQAQRARTGRVRAIVLKARQWGCSTYVAARLFHRLLHGRGLGGFIMTQDRRTSQAIYRMVQRFLEHLPAPLAPSLGSRTAEALVFDRLDCSLRIGSAGGRATGRGQTVQLLHASEVAFWRDAEAHAAGLLQAVPEDAGTEVVLESTANGPSGWFHRLWQQAEAGEGPFEPIFVPWYAVPKYAAAVPEGFALQPEEEELHRRLGLSHAQLAWRRAKLAALPDARLFAAEYPATAAEAFRLTAADGYIAPLPVLKAQAAVLQPGPQDGLVLGVDVARFGRDSSVILRRRGRVVTGVDAQQGWDTMQVAGWVAKVIEAERPATVCIDACGLGAGVVDRLRERGFGRLVVAVQGAERAEQPDRHANRRAECWARMKDWLEDALPVSLPNDAALLADLVSVGYRYDSQGRLLLESKDALRRRGLRSPDRADALALTFAAPLVARSSAVSASRTGSWMEL